ncbi:protein of unknown function [Hyphomicrobium sp. 1Nfss2.1]
MWATADAGRLLVAAGQRHRRKQQRAHVVIVRVDVRSRRILAHQLFHAHRIVLRHDAGRPPAVEAVCLVILDHSSPSLGAEEACRMGQTRGLIDHV